ncbi:hypothetical protein [Streptomyces sp. ok210]|jgi:hypothetical protein|uniref:hypothetical protein n=1 Tax=Streptomyces sp. ok210 TaxID=1761905 RepID=UPI0008E53763|nr:hypothetical protein [Streptomyces sp. ok210]SFT21904.1 hypothetical protein SAMN04487982_110135 [Streptomyces sp. ok210]
MTANQRPRSAPNDRELRLWRVGRALFVTFVAAVLVAGSVFCSLVYLLDFQEIDSTAKLGAKTLFDLVKLFFGVVAGAGALVALVVAVSGGRALRGPLPQGGRHGSVIAAPARVGTS